MLTLAIIVITCAVSLITMQNQEIKNRFMFNAYAINHNREWWRFLTHGLLHANFGHLFFNMFSLYFFGGGVEAYLNMNFGTVNGMMIYLLLYIGGLVMSSIFSYFKHKEDYYYNALGASGAVSAVIYTFILFNPLAKIYMFGLLGLPAWIFGIAYLAISYYLGRRGNDNIGHDAHFWGAVYGFLLPLCFKPDLWYNFIGQIHAFFTYQTL
jgi:membrane associated rhomboid family serine protease